MSRLRPGGGTAALDRLDAPRYGHLQRLSDGFGVFEHARYDVPRRSHGYCVDDVARALLVTVREPEQTDALGAMTSTSLRFLQSAIAPTGRAHNRRNADGLWTDEPAVGDWWGRAVWATGVVSIHAVDPSTRGAAETVFRRATQCDPVTLHTGAFAALGAGAVLLAESTSAALATWQLARRFLLPSAA